MTKIKEGQLAIDFTLPVYCLLVFSIFTWKIKIYSFNFFRRYNFLLCYNSYKYNSR